MFQTKAKFDANKTKVNLKMLTNRFQLLTQKKANLAKQQKRQVAMLLRDDKEQNARILVEHIIREERAARVPSAGDLLHWIALPAARSARNTDLTAQRWGSIAARLGLSLHPALSGLYA